MIPEYIGPEDLLTMPPKRETLGKQWVDMQMKYGGQFTQEVGETTEAMGKKYMDSLWKAVDMGLKSPNHNGDFYIMEIMKPQSFLECAIELKHVVRITRPVPEWGLGLYKYHRDADELTYEWGLPHVREAEQIVKNPENYDPKLVKDIVDFVEGRLDGHYNAVSAIPN